MARILNHKAKLEKLFLTGYNFLSNYSDNLLECGVNWKGKITFGLNIFSCTVTKWKYIKVRLKKNAEN